MYRELDMTYWLAQAQVALTMEGDAGAEEARGPEGTAG
jgi:hypothetical protein